MKTITKFLALAAVAVAALSSCAKDVSEPASGAMVSFDATITAPMPEAVAIDPETKVYLEQQSASMLVPKWENGDEIVAIVGTASEALAHDWTANYLSNTNPTGVNPGVFSGTLDIPASWIGVPKHVYAYYPSSAFTGFSYAYLDGKYIWVWGVNMPEIQHPAAPNSVDPEAYVLVSQPTEHIFDGNSVALDDIRFGAPFCIVELGVRGVAEGETVQSATISVFGQNLSGTIYVSEEGQYLSTSGSTAKDNVRVEYSPETTFVIGDKYMAENGTEYERTINFLVAPFYLEAGEPLEVEVVTDQSIFRKTVALGKAYNFSTGGFKRIVFNTTEEDRLTLGHMDAFEYGPAGSIEPGVPYVIANAYEFPECPGIYVMSPSEGNIDFLYGEPAAQHNDRLVLASRSNEIYFEPTGDGVSYFMKQSANGRYIIHRDVMRPERFTFSSIPATTDIGKWTMNSLPEGQIESLSNNAPIIYAYNTQEGRPIFAGANRGMVPAFPHHSDLCLYRYLGEPEKVEQTVEIRDERNRKFYGESIFFNETPTTPHAIFNQNPVVWKSSHPEVATIDAGGNITVHAPGTTTITALADESTYVREATASYDLEVLPKAIVNGLYYRWAQNEDGTYSTDAIVTNEQFGDPDVDYEFTLYDYPENQNELYIPSTIMVKGMSLPVVAVDDYAFCGSRYLNQVFLGDNVRRIGDKAFFNCYHLTYFNINNVLEYVGDSVFGNCARLNDIRTLDGQDSNPNFHISPTYGDLYWNNAQIRGYDNPVGKSLVRMTNSRPTDSVCEVEPGTQFVMPYAIDHIWCPSYRFPPEVIIEENNFSNLPGLFGIPLECNLVSTICISSSYNHFTNYIFPTLCHSICNGNFVADLSNVALNVENPSAEECRKYKNLDRVRRQEIQDGARVPSTWFYEVNCPTIGGGVLNPLNPIEDYPWE